MYKNKGSVTYRFFLLPCCSIKWMVMGGWVRFYDAKKLNLKIISIFAKVKMFLMLYIETNASFQKSKKQTNYPGTCL